MATISLTQDPHASRIADYLADGYTLVDYLHDHAFQCDHCGLHHDDKDDGMTHEATGLWFCLPCVQSGDYRDSL